MRDFRDFVVPGGERLCQWGRSAQKIADGSIFRTCTDQQLADSQSPWKQTDIEKNLAGEPMDTAEYYTAECRKLFELRMRLLPYLYSAFVEYSHSGKPPIRALVLGLSGG